MDLQVRELTPGFGAEVAACVGDPLDDEPFANFGQLFDEARPTGVPRSSTSMRSVPALPRAHDHREGGHQADPGAGERLPTREQHGGS